MAHGSVEFDVEEHKLEKNVEEQNLEKQVEEHNFEKEVEKRKLEILKQLEWEVASGIRRPRKKDQKVVEVCVVGLRAEITVDSAAETLAVRPGWPRRRLQL